VSRIFISYRRSDGAGYAGRIFDRLQNEFGTARVYRDVDSLEDGTRFPDDIAEQLTKCRIMLVVIGPTWCDARNATGSRRLDDPGDWVRIEVTEALRRGLCVIRLLLAAPGFPIRVTCRKTCAILPNAKRANFGTAIRGARTWICWFGELPRSLACFDLSGDGEVSRFGLRWLYWALRPLH
jgi:hypothetical protein